MRCYLKSVLGITLKQSFINFHVRQLLLIIDEGLLRFLQPTILILENDVNTLLPPRPILRLSAPCPFTSSLGDIISCVRLLHPNSSAILSSLST
ncbi:hypothetical protein KFK09_018836 [Dendrobium nobile]|uniref:Uncharacterized protein n=1 Tax=Dendrobium nobile TaxID=94219 RepID=A0A8T3AY60_DENNO|nr:hypothetical protein KFK09_018836 [Dendrobium nobile]